MLLETCAVAGILGIGSAWLVISEMPWWWCVLPVVAQGFWFQRLYVVGHEAAHRKLFPRRPRLNDVWGQVALTPILVPLSIFRMIHRFHHGGNRRDANTAALDVYVVPPGAGRARRAWCWLLWYLGVFGGGWFVHSLVSIVLFLCLPVPLARRVSPAFRGWNTGAQVRAMGIFGLGVGAHVAVALGYGTVVWWVCLGLPFGVFALVYSVQLYVYHYDTTMGRDVRFHVRSLGGSPVVSWWLLNLNEHATHHREPSIVWYALPDHRQPLPEAHRHNQNVETFWQGVTQQLKGPTIVEKA